MHDYSSKSWNSFAGRYQKYAWKICTTIAAVCVCVCVCVCACVRACVCRFMYNRHGCVLKISYLSCVRVHAHFMEWMSGECTWHHKTCLVQLTLGNKVVLSACCQCWRHLRESRTLKHSEEITCTVVKKKKQCEMNRPLVLDVCTETSNTQATWMQFSKRFKRWPRVWSVPDTPVTLCPGRPATLPR